MCFLANDTPTPADKNLHARRKAGSGGTFSVRNGMLNNGRQDGSEGVRVCGWGYFVRKQNGVLSHGGNFCFALLPPAAAR